MMCIIKAYIKGWEGREIDARMVQLSTTELLCFCVVVVLVLQFDWKAHLLHQSHLNKAIIKNCLCPKQKAQYVQNMLLNCILNDYVVNTQLLILDLLHNFTWESACSISQVLQLLIHNGYVIINVILTHQNLQSWTTAANCPNFSQWVLLHSEQQSESCFLWFIPVDQNVLLEADRQRGRKDEYEISNHHRAYSPISCWLCFLLCLHSQCTLLIRQLLSSYSETSIPALLHPTLYPNSISHINADTTCTIPDYFLNKFWLVLYYHLFNISVPPPTHPTSVFCIDLFALPIQSPIVWDNIL